jgi:hypothetical protein
VGSFAGDPEGYDDEGSVGAPLGSLKEGSFIGDLCVVEGCGTLERMGEVPFTGHSER